MTIEEAWYGRGPAALAARAALRPLSLLYASAVGLRALAYDRGWKGIAQAPAPVISVGSLRVGGAGKTPLVIELARQLSGRGIRPCVVTRGYGGRGDASRPRLLLPPAGGLEPSLVAEVGDEAALLALRCGCPVALGSDRAQACALAFRELAASGRAPAVFLLDDGFQHRRLARDLDVVLVDGREPFEALLPAGPLREGPGALARAGVLVTAADGELPWPVGPRQPVLRMRTRATALVEAVTDRTGEPPSSLAGKKVVAVAAIARPGRFVATLEGLGAHVVASVLRRDHHLYDEGDLREIATTSSGVDLVVTTEKDLVKLDALREGRARLRALRIDVDFDGDGSLVDRIARIAHAAPGGAPASAPGAV